MLDQLAAAGTLFLILSGGELLLRRDFFDLLAYARGLGFDVKLKTNGILLNARAAARIRDLGVRQVQISIYSHRAEVHDAITKVPGSLARSIDAIRSLKAQGLHVLIANVLMRQNAGDYPAVRALAAELGVECTIDPTITPKMDGDRSIVGAANLGAAAVARVPGQVAGARQRRRGARDRRGDAGRPAVQRRAHRLLHLAVRRRLSVRAVSAANRQRAPPAIRGDLERIHRS